MGKLDMFRLALDSEEQVWGYGQALLAFSVILLHNTSSLLFLLPSLSFFPYLFPLLLYSSLICLIPDYVLFLVSIILLLSSSFLYFPGFPHSPLLSFSSPSFFLVRLLFFFHVFYFFHGPFCQVQPKTTKGWVTWESGENWDVLTVPLIISVCG